MFTRMEKLPGDFEGRYKSENLKDQIADEGTWGLIPAVTYSMSSPEGVKRLESIFDLQHMQDDIQKLSDYYGCKQWRKDLESDEQGLFPDDLKRGVLSEDGIYNMLERNKEVMEMLKPFFED